MLGERASVLRYAYNGRLVGR